MKKVKRKTKKVTEIENSGNIGILSYDLEDKYLKSEMLAAADVNSFICAIQDYDNQLRSIAKYGPSGEMSENMKKLFQEIAPMFRDLLLETLIEHDVDKHLN